MLQIKTIFSLSLVNRWKKFYSFIMEKYHKDIGFKDCHVKEALNLIEALQGVKLRFSVHSLQELGQEADAVNIGRFLVNYRLNWDDVFELAFYAGRLEKLGFRVKFGEKDIIFILSRDKSIITVWLNDVLDCHKTLNTSFYCKVLN